VNKKNCIEIYFIDSFNPRHANGDGIANGLDTAACQIISSDDGSATDSVLLAHELGHCLDLPHPNPPDGSVMVPTGQPAPNPPGQGSFTVPPEVCAKIRQPLLRRTKKDCCKATCDGTDSTAPTCTGTVSGDTLTVTVQDAGSGLRTVEVTAATNTSRTKGDLVRGFVNGTVQPFSFTVDKTNPELPSSISFKINDVCGNTATCDPVVALVARDPGKPVTQTLGDVADTEGFLLVVNQTPGLQDLSVGVNGVPFPLRRLKDGEQLTLDIFSALQPGSHNVVSLTAHGKPGGSATVMIHD
jgi:hypothetical protein